MKKYILAALLTVGAMTVFAAADEDLCVFRGGAVVYEASTSLIDSVSVKDGSVALYDKDGTLLYSTPQGSVDSIRFLAPVPKADLLDVVFQTDGTAVDISPKANKVERVGAPAIILSSRYGRFMSQYNNTWSGTASDYFKVNYEDDEAFRSALADGHTMEVLVKANYSGTLPDKEAKYFSSHQAGGTGLMICTKAHGKDGGNEFTFLPNVSTNGKSSWKWASSGVVPVSGQYYHVVGVWNKAAGKAYIYVDGVLKNTVAASGNLNFPTSGCGWFALGGDPSTAVVANTSWNGDVVLARIYDAPLTTAQVSSLYKRVEVLTNQEAKDLVSNVHFYSGLDVKAGGSLTIWGSGFQEGDQIVLTDIADTEKTCTLSVTLDGTTAIHVALPADIATGQYRMMVQRGERKQDLGLNALNVRTEMPRAAQVIAHRGYWNTGNVSQNSRQSLQLAFDHDFYGSETDIWLTSDGELVVNHDATLNGVTLQTSTYEQVKDLTLSNGEKIPRFSEFLNMLKGSPTKTKLIIEIKTHSTLERNLAAAEATVKAVKEMELEDRVEYIAFSYDICKRIAELEPTATVSYLCSSEGSVKTPQELHDVGIRGIDYNAAMMAAHPDFVEQAHALGMVVNVWTINANDQIIQYNRDDYDFVTTNNPVEAQEIYEHYLRNK